MVAKAFTISPQFGTERQRQVYTAGLNKQHPLIPADPELLEQEAKERMSPEAWGYQWVSPI